MCACTFSEVERKKKVNESDRGDDGPSEDPGGLGSHAGAPGVCPDGTAGSTEGTGGAPDAGTCAAGRRTAAQQNTPRIHLPKMAAEDDAQAFLEAFEVAVEAFQWSREEWVVRLLPLLLGEAQQAAYSLPLETKKIL